MTDRRVLVSPERLAPGEGSDVSISGPEHHHLSRVLRLRPDDAVSVFDGSGKGFFGTIVSVGREATVVRLGPPDLREVEPRFRVTLAQALPQHDRLELVIQKTTELGVAHIIPLLTGRVPSSESRALKGGRLERWRRVAREAARQSGRRVVPSIAEPVDWRGFVTGDLPSPRFLLDTGPMEGGNLPADLSGEGQALVVVGPEGGWEEEERVRANQAGFVPVGLGPRVLRTETAAIIAVALILHAAGDLGPHVL